MSLPHAILGLLQDEPMTGYDLKTREFDQSVAHFWAADQAQVYRTLDKMTEEGWVESEIQIQDDRPNRKLYRITDTGRAALHRWLTTRQALPAYRQPFLVQIYFAEGLSNEKIISLMQHQLEAHQSRLSNYKDVPLPSLNDPTASREQTLQRLTLELGIKIEQTYIEWLQESIEVARRLKE